MHSHVYVIYWLMSKPADCLRNYGRTSVSESQCNYIHVKKKVSFNEQYTQADFLYSLYVSELNMLYDCLNPSPHVLPWNSSSFSRLYKLVNHCNQKLFLVLIPKQPDKPLVCATIVLNFKLQCLTPTASSDLTHSHLKSNQKPHVKA